jgi:threonine 3-dehydrogenase
MKALILDIKRDEWDTTTGMTFADVDEPKLDEANVPNDGGRVLIKPIYTGFCGSDKGIWFRHAFKDMIFDSMESEGKSTRVSGSATRLRT